MGIPPEDRVTYEEARRITGRSHGYLFRLAKEGRLSRQGGQRGQSRDTWLSRPEVEGLAIAEDRPHRRTNYWCTLAEAAEVLGVTKETVRTQLPTFKVSTRRVLVRTNDVARAALHRSVQEPRQPWPVAEE